MIQGRDEEEKLHETPSKLVPLYQGLWSQVDCESPYNHQGMNSLCFKGLSQFET